MIDSRAPAAPGFAPPKRGSRRPGRNWLTVFVAAAILLAAGRLDLLRAMGAFLVVDEPLQPAAAIVALAGQTPQRENEAAALYRAGWAPVVIIVSAVESNDLDTDARLRTLVELGVPEAAIVTVVERAQNTREELDLAARAVPPGPGALILVTSKYHTRRVLVTWDRQIGGDRPAIVRTAPLDTFDPDTWWEDAGLRVAVVHEYLGLVQVVASWPH